jgi:hypothetical protein
MHVHCANPELWSEQQPDSVQRYVVLAFVITAVFTVILAFQHSNYEVNAISRESFQSVNLYRSQERLDANDRRNNTELLTTRNVLQVHNEIAILGRSARHNSITQNATSHLTTLARKLNSVSQSSANADAQNRIVNFLMTIEALDNSSSLSNIKPVHGRAERNSMHRPAAPPPLPPAQPTDRPGKYLLLDAPRHAAQATSEHIDEEHRAARPDHAGAAAHPAPAHASGRGVLPPAAGNRLAALQEFLRTIEELDRAP